MDPMTHALGFLPACLIFIMVSSHMTERTQVDLEKEHQVDMSMSVRQHWGSLAGDDRRLF